MKVKTSVTLSKEALKALDLLAGRKGNRSQVIERAVFALLSIREREERDKRDVALINQRADDLNQMMAEVLEFQVND